jgi:trk system potassium uptake protein TrkA
MKIVIAGAGNVGTHLAELLSKENHDIALIDNDEERLKATASTVDLITYLGSAVRISTLFAAGIPKADLFIAVTRNESVNITAAVLGKKMGAKKSIARIDNLEYLEPDNAAYFTEMGIDYMFYPELIAADELVGLVKQTGMSETVTFAGGSLMLFLYKI